MSEYLQIAEIYRSIQGESSFAGLPCTFVRLIGCPLRCRWCDTVHAFKGGQSMEQSEVLRQVQALEVPLVELTGGEPLAQAMTVPLMQALVDAGYQVLIETGGSECIAAIAKQVHIVMDIKCPGSGMSDRNLLSNIDYIKKSDELKFVIANHDDFIWAQQFIEQHNLHEKAQILLSPVFGLLEPQQLVEWMLASGLQARLNLQIHKYIWHPRAKGV